MSNAKKIYESVFGKIPDGYEIHHILPKHSEGKDNIENLIAVSAFEHAKMHLERYQKYGDFRDLCAYYMIGYNFSEAHRLSSSEGGKKGGHIVKNNKIGIFRSNEERLLWASMGGKIGGKKQAEMGLGFHQYKNNPELHKQWCSKGGLTSGKFQDKNFQSEMGRRGGKKNKGSIWINDGKKNFKYTIQMQNECSLEIYLKNNSNIRRGRIND